LLFSLTPDLRWYYLCLIRKMRRTQLLVIGLFFGSTLVYGQTIDGNDPPVVDVAVGAGYSRAFSVIDWQTDSWIFPGPSPVELFSTPALTFDAHVAVAAKFCVGFAASYQGIRTGLSDGGVTFDHGFLYERINIAFRPLFVFPLSSGLTLHTGLRLGYTFWQESRVFEDPLYPKDPPDIPNMPSAQLVGGIRYAIGHIGLGVEFGVGTAPYLAQGHVFYRFGKY
jgi:hypothetical protein